MEALTVCQPYSHLIAIGEKWVENRTWYPPRRLIRQYIAIHAGKSRYWLEPADSLRYPAMPFGAIESVARLAAAFTLEQIAAFDNRHAFARLRGHVHVEGPVCLVLTDVRRLPEPIAINGAQGFWKVPDDVVVRIGELLQAKN